MIFRTLPRIASVVLVASCATTTGNFCDVATRLEYKSVEVADYVVDNDPRLADSIELNNRVGEELCGWKFGR